MKSIIINNKELSYIIERKNVKNINIRVRNGIVYISANKSVSEEYIIQLIKHHSEKILKSVDKTQNVVNTSITKYLGKEYPIKITESHAFKVVFDNEKFTVFSPDKSDEENILFLIANWKSEKCLEIYADINNRVYNKFCNAGYDVPLASISVKLMKSRWGSCNYVTGCFSINLKLIDYPLECIYGVFCHEYMHFIHQNHSVNFYNDLKKIFPDYKKYDDLLKI